MDELHHTRRQFLKRSATAVASLPALYGPYVHTKPEVTLRVLGTHVTLQEPIRQRAMKDLGIRLEFEPRGETELVQKASAQPESFDIYEQWSDSIRILWQSGAIQPIDTTRLNFWNEINPLSKDGRIVPGARTGLGDAPHTLLNVQSDGSLGTQFSGKVSFLPYVHNVDSFGYNASRIPEGEPYVSESWSWLLDDRWRGHVGLVNSPSIGLFDLALAFEAAGLMRFKNMADMSIDEIDQLFGIARDYKEAGQFCGFWTTVPQSVDYLESGRMWLGSLFSPAVASANGRGMNVIYAAPREGYRAWHGVMCLSSACSGSVQDAAYRYMNWWLSGWAGAYIARQGYYISNPERSRPMLSSQEWDYWYGGLPAAAPLQGTDGRLSVAQGELRTGGSYESRLSNIAVWNTVMPNYEYTLERWYELLVS